MAATSFFGGEFFGGEFFNTPAAPADEATRPRPDDGGRRRGIVKPTGLAERKKLRVPEGRKTVDERVADSIAIQEEAAGAIARQLREQIDNAEAFRPVARMSLAEIDREIGILLRKKLRNEDDEVLLLMLMAAAAAV